MKLTRTMKLKLNTNVNEWYDTFDAYIFAQFVRALRNLGLLT